MRKKLLQAVSLVVLPIVIGVFASGSVAAAPESLCKIFAQLNRPLSKTGIGRYQTGLDKYQLSGTYSGGMEGFTGLDIDGDAIEDRVEKSCPGSNEPSDPCTLTIKLSTSEYTLDFEAWGFRLFRYRKQLYIAANADETRKKTNIYKIDKSGYEQICEKL